MGLRFADEDNFLLEDLLEDLLEIVDDDSRLVGLPILGSTLTEKRFGYFDSQILRYLHGS